MDSRIPLLASSVAGATLGVLVMVASTPDTGTPGNTQGDLLATTALAPPGRAAVPDIARPLPPASRSAGPARTAASFANDTDAPNPFEELARDDVGGEPNNPFSNGGEDPFGRPAANPFGGEDEVENPFAALAEENGGDPFGEPPADNPWAGLADNPFGNAGGWGQPSDPRAQEPKDLTPLSPRAPSKPSGPDAGKGGFPPQITGAKTDLPPDVRGVGRLFRERDPAVRKCMETDAPATVSGERRVMIRVHLASRSDNPSKAGITMIEAPKDDEGRYRHFLTCLHKAVADAVFENPTGGAATVNWSLRR